jgi:3-hydroxyisobutyrate dehydrogenase-like beta-hydroxyacid dehydrogenase
MHACRITQIAMAATSAVRVGWIGLGVMGHSMASHILAAGYPTTIFTRTKSKADDLIAKVYV